MDVVEQLKSALSNRYAIEREIGQGGMATVYLARDVRHDRRVALKVLNPELGAVVGKERFLAEIRVTANLQHPHLLPLFDSGDAEGQLFYVMPFVDGESLRDRIRREKQLPVDEAVRIASAVGNALDYAHRHGVIHRDLKPENILLQDGHPFVADFGIALAVSVAGGARITQTGLSLGTPQYMSPEQATGDRTIDGRTDIYSLSAMLYEMLTGDPPHTGSTAQAIIAKVITDRPRAIRLSRESVPPHVEAAVDCALAKLPADRFATALEFVDAIRGLKPVMLPAGYTTPASISTDPAVAAARRRSRIRHAIPWIVAAGALLALAAVSLRPAAPRPMKRFILTLPDSARLRTPTGVTIALSRDGSKIVYTGGQEGAGPLFVREMSDIGARAVAGTERGQNPSFSPDGRSIVFSVDGKVKRVASEGGTAITVADTAAQPSWTVEGSIVFIRLNDIYRTSPNGERPSVLARADTARDMVSLTWPRMLPGGEGALVTINLESGERHIGVIEVSSGEVVDLGLEGSNAHYLPTGHIIFGRPGNAVFGATFDLGALRAIGEGVPLIEHVIVKPGGATEVAVADDGTMIYRSGAFLRSLVFVDERGVSQSTIGEPGLYVWPRFSPDGKRIAVTLGGTTDATRNDTWVYDTQAGALTRLTQGERPEWTPDGKDILTVQMSGARRGVATQPWDGSGAASVYTTNVRQIMEVSLPRQRRGYLAVRVSAGAQRDILIAPLDSPRALRPFLATAADEFQPVVSPDGTRLAYVSDESGRTEVYVRPIPGPGARVQISTGGGSEPVWSPTESKVFYRAGGKIMSASLTGSGEAATVTRQVLFDDLFMSGGPSRANYAVSPDGRRFLFAKPIGDTFSNVVTLNWFEEVRQRMARPR